MLLRRPQYSMRLLIRRPCSLQRIVLCSSAATSLLYAFFFAAAFALAAFFLLLRIMTMARNDPTTADPTRMRITGIRMAQTRGGKKLWSDWSSSTNGWS
jgi:hypothetical protein